MHTKQSILSKCGRCIYLYDAMFLIAIILCVLWKVDNSTAKYKNTRFISLLFVFVLFLFHPHSLAILIRLFTVNGPRIQSYRNLWIRCQVSGHLNQHSTILWKALPLFRLLRSNTLHMIYFLPVFFSASNIFCFIKLHLLHIEYLTRFMD